MATDSWEQLEEDIDMAEQEYCSVKTPDAYANCIVTGMFCSICHHKAADIIVRAKALAGGTK